MWGRDRSYVEDARTGQPVDSPGIRAARNFHRRNPNDNYVITIYMGNEYVKVPWGGRTDEDTMRTFMNYLTNDEFDEDFLPSGWRAVDLHQAGSSGTTVFRTDLVSGFTVTRIR